MEYVTGQTLHGILEREGRLEHDVVINIGIQTAMGLKDAHLVNIIHRDMKPDNMMVDLKGNVKITDFGLAKVESATTHLTKEGAVLGTPLYMSPEQARGDIIDWRTDFYSLGASLYHLYRGTPPFDGESGYAIIYKHIHDPLEGPKKGGIPIPAKTWKVLKKLMAKDASDRYRSAEELITDLEKCYVRKGIDYHAELARLVIMKKAAAGDKSAEGQEGQETTFLPHGGGGGPPPIPREGMGGVAKLMIALFLIVAIAVGGFFVWRAVDQAAADTFLHGIYPDWPSGSVNVPDASESPTATKPNE
jgi:serine/threonine-protein kinase